MITLRKEDDGCCDIRLSLETKVVYYLLDEEQSKEARIVPTGDED